MPCWCKWSYTCPHAHLLYIWGDSSNLTEGLLERAIKFAGSRPQVTGLAKCLAIIWPPCSSYWLCWPCSMPIRWAWVDVVSKWVMAKMLETPMLEERNARTLCDPQTGTIWVIAIAKEWPVKQEVFPTPLPLSSRKLLPVQMPFEALSMQGVSAHQRCDEFQSLCWRRLWHKKLLPTRPLLLDLDYSSSIFRTLK